MFESGVFRTGTLAARGRDAAGMLPSVRRSAAQSLSAAGTAVPNEGAPDGELSSDGAPALAIQPFAKQQCHGDIPDFLSLDLNQ
jgi:hypothetical protein